MVKFLNSRNYFLKKKVGVYVNLISLRNYRLKREPQRLRQFEELQFEELQFEELQYKKEGRPKPESISRLAQRRRFLFLLLLFEPSFTIFVK